MDSTEKVSVNMNIGTLSQIDLLVDLGYYSNRSDFINQAVRQVLEKKRSIVESENQRHRAYNEDWFTGIYVFTEAQLRHAQENGKKIKLRGYGVAVIDKSLDELALDTIEEISVKGKVLCSGRVKEHLGLK
ncbi:MAG: hypothetical protein J5633_00205 [Oscillospiraceae bacterium]|nr:hypothetical protein [Oscillospiraceae bacterium]MBR5678804.1 hypothetical protein [Paludibacteraceae bacterium]